MEVASLGKLALPVDPGLRPLRAMEGVLADKTQALLLEALARLAAAPNGLPLLAAKGSVGICAANAAGKQIAEIVKSEAYACVVRQEATQKTVQDIHALSEKGLAFLVEGTSPRLVLEALVSALRASSNQITTLINGVRAGQGAMAALQAHTEKVLQQLDRPSEPSADHPKRREAILAYLKRRHDTGTLADCPLPDIYRHLQSHCPSLTVGQYHDWLRRLNAEAALYLHPWTGPLYELPEPALALLVGHEIAYYASLRMPQPLAA